MKGVCEFIGPGLDWTPPWGSGWVVLLQGEEEKLGIKHTMRSCTILSQLALQFNKSLLVVLHVKDHATLCLRWTPPCRAKTQCWRLTVSQCAMCKYYLRHLYIEAELQGDHTQLPGVIIAARYLQSSNHHKQKQPPIMIIFEEIFFGKIHNSHPLAPTLFNASLPCTPPKPLALQSTGQRGGWIEINLWYN